VPDRPVPTIWRVRFVIEEWDEVRTFDVTASDSQQAVAIARVEHPWESDVASSIMAWELEAPDGC